MTTAYPAQPARRIDLRPLLPLYLVIFIGFCGYSLMITLFVPMLMGANGFVAADATVGERSLVLGLLLAIYPLGQFIGAPVLGALSDRYGRKPLLVGSLVVTILAYAVISAGIEWRSLVTIAAGCFIGGLAESNIAIAQSAISDVADPDERPRLFAWTCSSCSLGYIAGPIIGGQLALALGWSAPFWATVPLLVAALLWISAQFKETREPDRSKGFDAVATLANLASVVTDRPIRRLYLLNFLIYFALFGYFRMVLVYLVDRWHTSVDQTTLIYSGLALISAIASFGLMAPLTRRLGLERLAVVACIVAGIAMMLVTAFPMLGSIWLTAGSTTLAGTIALSACPTILSNAVAMDRQGRVLGNNQALQVGAESLSAIAGGAMAGIFVSLPLLAFGAMLIGCALLLLLFGAGAAATAGTIRPPARPG